MNLNYWLRSMSVAETNVLILHATNAIQFVFGDAFVVPIVAVARTPAVSIVAIALGGTPPIAAEAETVETATGITASAR